MELTQDTLTKKHPRILNKRYYIEKGTIKRKLIRAVRANGRGGDNGRGGENGRGGDNASSLYISNALPQGGGGVGLR